MARRPRSPRPKDETKAGEANAQAQKSWWIANRGLIGRLLLELFIVFIGVTAAFALDGWRQERAEAQYRREMIVSLGASIDGIALHNIEILSVLERRIGAFDAALARGEQPAPPVYRERGAERPPTGAWSGIVATGASRTLPPDLYFRVSEFFNRVEAWGDKYARYNEFTETRVLPIIDDPGAFYTPTGELRGEFRVYVDRLRDIAALSRQNAIEARNLRRDISAANR